MAREWIERLTQDDESLRLFQQERTILEITELICRLMRDQGVSRAQLAQRLNTSRSHVSQLLDGTTNMTLRTLSDVLFAVGRSLVVDDEPLKSRIGDGGLFSMSIPWPDTCRWSQVEMAPAEGPAPVVQMAG